MLKTTIRSCLKNAHRDTVLCSTSRAEIRIEGREVQGEEGEIGVEEVRRAVRKMKSGKAGGVCGIQVEMMKAGGYTMVQ